MVHTHEERVCPIRKPFLRELQGVESSASAREMGTVMKKDVTQM